MKDNRGGGVEHGPEADRLGGANAAESDVRRESNTTAGSGATANTPRGPDVGPDSDQQPLSPAQVLIRASIDIRGRRPSLSELDAVAQEPQRLDEFLNNFVDDSGFADSVADLFARALRNRSDSYQGVEDEDGEGQPATYQQSAADEPLMLIRHIVENDLSYDEFLTADYTFANEDLAEFWGLANYNYARGGWQQVRYGDNRPAAGYLAQTSPFMRFLNDDANYNRGRANAISRILVCDDFLKRPVDFPRDLDLSDEDAINRAISTNAACTSCHDQLDPIASFFWVYPEPEDLGIALRYRPDRAEDWMDTTGKAPAYYGREGNDLADLSQFILEDPRYVQCVVRRVFEGLLDRPTVPADAASLRAHGETFEASGRRLKVLFRSVLADPLYRGVSGQNVPGTVAKMLSPETLQRVVTALTGFEPRIEGVDIVREEAGLRVLGGGLSALSGDYPSRTANLTRVLVQERLAEAAALYLVEEDGERATQVAPEVDLPPDERAIEHLYQTFLSRLPSAEERSALLGLYSELIVAGAESNVAYAALISVLMRDPEFLIY